MCKDAKIEGQFINHSLRATGATELFRNNVPEKVVQQFTEHWSIKYLRQYEKASMDQKMIVSNVLTRCEEECGTSGTTHSSHDVIPYKPSLPNVTSNNQTFSDNYPSFAPTFSKQDAVNFEYLSFWCCQSYRG